MQESEIYIVCAKEDDRQLPPPLLGNGSLYRVTLKELAQLLKAEWL